MTRLKLLPLALASLLAFPAHAAVDLIAIDGLSANDRDLSTQAGALESGVPGNLLGGLGSGFTYAGGSTYLALPDRGPNALAYDASVDNTTSYINRFQTLRIVLTPNAAGAALPFIATPTLTGTTLLHSARALAYGNSGAPALNATNHTNYFTGRSDGFDSLRLSTDPLDARLDPESIRVSHDGSNIFISDEYGPYIYRFNRRTGQRTGIYRLPEAFAANVLSPMGDTEIASNTVGRVANKGMEGLAISPDGTALFGIMQSPLQQDGGTTGGYTRIIRVDLETGATQQFVYPLTNIGTAAKPKYPTVSDIVAINNHEFLVDERDGKGLGDNSVAAFKRLYRIDLAGAPDVSNLTGTLALAPHAVSKTLFLDIVQKLNAFGIASKDIPAKLEGVSFGPDVVIGGVRKHTLFVANDNDFLPIITDSLHPAGVDNPNLFFVFSVDVGDLPTYVPQQFAKK
ncbi:esterase-like activity of phytase family protein [Lysobacter tyrosinilyticus]